MKKLSRRNVLVAIAVAFGITAVGGLNMGRADDDDETQSLRGRLVAIGIPGVSAVAPVGTFLPGGPIHDKPAFAAYTLPGRVLDPARILVGSTSNFGAPVAREDQLEGSFLSIDPRGGETLVILPGFAEAGNQASALGGFVRMVRGIEQDVFVRFHRSTITGESQPSSSRSKYTPSTLHRPREGPGGFHGQGLENNTHPLERRLALARLPVGGGHSLARLVQSPTHPQHAVLAAR